MPLETAHERVAQRGALGFIGRETQRPRFPASASRWPTETQIAQWLRREFSYMDDMTPQAARGLAARVLKAAKTAARLESRPQETPTREQHARDPTIGPAQERYRYVVVVTTGTTVENRVSRAAEVRSDTPLSRTEIEERVAARLDYYDSTAPSTREALARLPTAAAQDIRLIAAYTR